MDRIVRELAKQAKKNGICQEWYDNLTVTGDIESLAKMYLKGIDFCLSNEYPSIDFMRNNFKGKIEVFGIYIDDRIEAVNEKTLVALGGCSGMVEIKDYAVSEVFLKHLSSLVLIVKDNAFVMVDMFDETSLNIIASDNAKVCVNRYGGKVEFSSFNNAVVKLIEKNQKTY